MSGTDLFSLARTLAHTHDAVFTGHAPATEPRPLVGRSWQRMLRRGLDPAGRNERMISPLAEVESRRRATRLRLVIDELTAVLLRMPTAGDFLLVVTDADGIILWRDGATANRRQADRLGFIEGAVWTEDVVGTNAIGTAIAEETSVQLFSAEHFETTQHPWFCTAVPLHDPSTGDLLGVVDISGPALTLHPSVQTLVHTAVRLAEARLTIEHQLSLTRLRDRYSPVLACGTGPALVVDDDGWVAHSRGLHGRDRVDVPREGRALELPGIGLCLPERIDGGWLLRPTPEHTRVCVRLDHANSLVHITGAQGPTAVSLTPRRLQIVSAIDLAGPDGISAAALSRAIYGDADHVVAIRAEVSRLRRKLGALLRTRPYRWADDVESAE